MKYLLKLYTFYHQLQMQMEKKKRKLINLETLFQIPKTITVHSLNLQVICNYLRYHLLQIMSHFAVIFKNYRKKLTKTVHLGQPLVGVKLFSLPRETFFCLAAFGLRAPINPSCQRCTMQHIDITFNHCLNLLTY